MRAKISLLLRIMVRCGNLVTIPRCCRIRTKARKTFPRTNYYLRPLLIAFSVRSNQSLENASNFFHLIWISWGRKRDEKVATLETCHIKVKVKGASDKEKVKKAFEVATRYCSVFHTLSKVAEMTWEIDFE